MAGILFMTALAGLGLEIHPGAALRRSARETGRGGLLAGLAARSGEILAVGGLVGILAIVAALMPEGTLEYPPLRTVALVLSGASLAVAGWHRISTTSRLDLRRSRLLTRGASGGSGDRLLDGLLGEIRRPAWHLFWWACVPGLVITALATSPFAAPLVWVVYGAVAAAWSAFLGSRLGRGREKLIGTAAFRSLHSLGGLALVAAAGLLFVEALDWSGLPGFAIERVLGPVLGGGSGVTE